MECTKVPIYLSKNALEEVAVSSDLYPNFHNIFKYHAILCVDLTDEELDQELSDLESVISKFCNNNNIKTVALHSDFESLKNDSSIMIEKPRSMFILNITKEKADELTEKYGIIVQSETNINDNILQLDYDKGLRKDSVLEGSDNGWYNLFKDLSFPPSNSLIITDGFLFKNNSKNKSNDVKRIGFENLKLLLNAILPERLKTTSDNTHTHFHILIISSIPNISSKKINCLPREFKQYLTSIRSYDFQVEFVFTKTIHSRKIISNYFVIVCDHGIRTFYLEPANKVETSNEIRIRSILHNPQCNTPSSSDTFLTISQMNIEELRDSCNSTREIALTGIDPTKKIIGDCNENKTIKNRLLNCKL